MARHRVLSEHLHLGWLVPLLAIVLVGGGTTVAKLSSQHRPAPAPPSPRPHARPR